MIDDKLKGHFLNLYMLALCDNDFDERELETILKIGEEKGISKDEFERMIINPTSAKVDVPTDFISKIRLLYDFARVIWSDQKVDENEVGAFVSYCEKLGFPKTESIELFEWLIELAKRGVSSSEIENEVVKLSKD